MSDIIAQVEQIIIDHTSDDVSFSALAQDLSDAGLLARPAPTREQIIRAIEPALFNAGNYPRLGQSTGPFAGKIADAALALLSQR